MGAVISSRIARDDAAFRANADHNRALAERLRADVAKAGLGGGDAKGFGFRHARLTTRQGGRQTKLVDAGRPAVEKRITK